MDKQTNKSINFQQMVVSYFLSNMNSPHDLCLVGTKNIFFARPKSLSQAALITICICKDHVLSFPRAARPSARFVL